MSDPIQVAGGRFVPTGRWIEALEALGCRAEFRPGDTAPVLGGEVWVRFGHPAIGDDRDVLVKVRIGFFRPARDVPSEVVDQRRERLAEIRSYPGAPWTLVNHEAIVLGWVERGREGVVDALAALIDERRRDGATDEDQAEEIRWLAHWQQPDAELEQLVLFDAESWTEAGFLVASLLAATYATASGGALVHPQPSDTVEGVLAEQRTWNDGLFGGPPPAELLFRSWEELPPDEDEE